MKRNVVLLFLAVSMVMLVACTANVHMIGSGPQGHDVIEARQWYVLWGLVPINEVDTLDMADGAVNYEIKTESSALDIVINIFTSSVSVTSRTVTVTK